MRSGLLLLIRVSVDKIRSTYQINRRIIAKIYTLKASFKSDFFLFIILTKVQITKNEPEPMIVLKIKEGYLKAQAY